MSSHADAGLKAFNASKYDEAITLYTKALQQSKSPLWLIQRSTAYQRNKQYDLALADADAAVLGAIERGKRELIGLAQFRRAIALYKLERFGDSRMCLAWSRAKNDKEKGLSTWTALVVQEYEKRTEDDPKLQVTVVEVPQPQSTKPATSEKTEEKTQEKAPEEVAPSSTPAQANVQTAVQKIRYDWYQSSNTINISVMAKNIPKEAVNVNFEARELGVNFPVGPTDTYDLTLSPLHAEIDVSASKYTVMSTKLEIILQKAVPGIKWPSLEGTAEAPTSSSILPSITNTDKPPSYPTSSKNGPKNWDAKTFTMTDDAGKTEKIEFKEDELDEGDELSGFFKKIYKDADEDTKRAMMKSYVESNGTSLSTSWGDVGSKSFAPEE